MNGGLASPAARRSAVPESASRSRAEPAPAAPVREAPVAIVLNAAGAEVPSTRARMQASFGGAAQPGPAGASAAPAVAIERSGAVAPTTRERIANRARVGPAATPAPAEPAAAIVIDLAVARDRRRARQPDAAAEPGREAPLAPVIALAPTPELARPPPPKPAVAVEATPAAIPKTEPTSKADASAKAEVEPGAVSGRAAPETGAAAGVVPSAQPAAGAAPSAEPEAAAAEPAAETEPAEPEAAAPEAAAEPQPAAAEAAAPAAVPPAAPRVIRNPEDEPGFQAMKARTHRGAARTKNHQTGKEASETAQGASAPNPDLDVSGQAAAERVGSMGEQEPGPFDAADFKAKVKAAIEGMAPPANLEEADEFEKTGKAAGAKSQIEQLVLGGRDNSQRAIKDETANPPVREGKEPKTVTDIAHDARGGPLPGVGAAAALPGPRPAEQSDLSAGPLQVEARMIEANVTEEQLANANEPEFSAGLDARREVREHAETAPANYRAQEEAVLAGARAGAEGVAVTQLEGMHGARVETVGAVIGKKDETKNADQKGREDVHRGLLDIHTRTQADVTEILTKLDSTVDTIFTNGEKAARAEFEDYVDRMMRAYKADRYGGLFGGGYWLKDKLFDLPDEVNAFYRDGRESYLAAMDRVIDEVATLVGTQLGAAKLRIEVGREEVRAFVAGLDESLRTLGSEAAADLDNRFDQLDSDVDAKRDELVDTVARMYVESRDDLDSRIKELQEANKGLVSKAIDAIVGIIKTIYELGKLLLRVILKAAAAIGDIIAHPIRFLENLVGAVKGGLDRFVSRIGVHLQKALLDLLFGEIGSAGITMPKELDSAGILDLVTQVLGLTYQSIRARVVKRFGEDVVVKMEEKVDVFSTLVKEGVAGLWTWIKEKLADLEDLVVGKIKSYIIERVVTAGISYIVALLNPAAAFIKACQGIYQIVMFIVERAKQIAEFVEAILDSISAIAQGNVGAAIEKVESALANGLSLAIGFLARLANLGALSEKFRSIIALVRKPITRAVDQIIFGAAEVYRRTLGPAVAFGKAKLEAGREWAKGKVETGKAWVEKKAKSAKAQLTGREVVADAEEPTAQPPVEDEPAQPMRLVEEQIEIAPGESHTVFAQLAATGQVDVGVSSTPQLVTGLAAHFEPRIDTLPVAPPNPLPRGGEPTDQPQNHARTAVDRLRTGAGRLEQGFEQDYAQYEAQQADRTKRRIVAPYAPPARLTSQLDDLVGKHVRMLLRMFYAYDKPRFARVEDEPRGGQKLTARVWVWPLVTTVVTKAGEKVQVEEVLPESGRRGLDPKRNGRPGYDVIAPVRGLEAPVRGGVRDGAEQVTRGIVHRDPVPWESGQREVVVRTWAKGGTRAKASNTSHTERSFGQWFEAQGNEFHQRITAIEVRSLNSPCTGCTSVLGEVARLLGGRPRGVPKASLIVFWDQVYGDESGFVNPAAATRPADVDELVKAGWIVHGPRP